MLYLSKITRAISNTVKKSLLKSANKDNMVVLNIWQPGYKILQTVKNNDGSDREIKIFWPTSTTEAALSFLIKKYGSEQYLQFKDDIHPGHCSIQTEKGYLSIGTNEEFDNIGVFTQHKITYTDSFIKDVLAFNRFPEQRFDFYTLNVEEINKMIEFLIKSPQILYSLIGDRLILTEGESCATASYRCLQAGGINELLDPYRG